MRRLGHATPALRLTLAAGLCLTATGCFLHRQKPTVPVASNQPPIPLATPPEPAKPVVVEPQPVPPMPAVAIKPPRKRKKPAPQPAVPAPAPPATQVASSAAPPAVSVIGSLTTGEDTSPQRRQEAADLLASIDKRLKALPSSVSDGQKAQVVRVRNFATQAQQALQSGDLDGAITLATKAKLLLDDLTK